MDLFRAAIIGCGRIGSTFDDDPLRRKVASHAGAYSAVAGVELAAAVDIDETRLQAFGARWGVSELFSDHREMLARVKPDIVSVCTWPQGHYRMVLDAVEAGAKAIFCEKPIAVSPAEATEMVRLCNEKGVALAVNHSRRWDPFIQEIKARLESGEIGEIQQVSCYYTAGLANTGTHLLDLLRYFLGDAVRVWGVRKSSHTPEDPNFDGYIDFAGGASVTLQSLDVKRYLIFDVDLYGTVGRLRVTNSGSRALWWSVVRSKMFSGYSELAAEDTQEPDESAKSPLVAAVEDIVDCIGSRRQPLSSGEDGLRALELILALRESARSGLSMTLPLETGMSRSLSLD